MNSIEYQLAEHLLSPIVTKRTGISHFQHVAEGVEILQAIGASVAAQKAFCIHPLVQKSDDFHKNYWYLSTCDPLAVALAIEYRWVANRGTRSNVKANNWKVEISDFLEVNQMLIADKVQNRKDFLASFKSDNPDFDELDRYFKLWLASLGISETTYNTLVTVL